MQRIMNSQFEKLKGYFKSNVPMSYGKKLNFYTSEKDYDILKVRYRKKTKHDAIRTMLMRRYKVNRIEDATILVHVELSKSECFNMTELMSNILYDITRENPNIIAYGTYKIPTIQDVNYKEMQKRIIDAYKVCLEQKAKAGKDIKVSRDTRDTIEDQRLDNGTVISNSKLPMFVEFGKVESNTLDNDIKKIVEEKPILVKETIDYKSLYEETLKQVESLKEEIENLKFALSMARERYKN